MVHALLLAINNTILLMFLVVYLVLIFGVNEYMNVASFKLKVGLAEMLKGGVIMDVVNAEQAVIAEDAGAVAVMALERVPSDIRREGGVARMANIEIIESVMKTVTIPVMAKVRIGHFAEAQILESLGVDFIDESEVLTPADETYHVDKHIYSVPFVCGATDLGEALRRVNEGAAMIRSKGEPGTGNVVEAVRHIRSIRADILALKNMNEAELEARANEMRVPLSLVKEVRELGKLPVPLFSAGGIATPADAALMMQLGSESVFVGSGIYKSEDPSARARAIVKATTHFNDPKILLEVSKDLRGAMPGLDVHLIPQEERMQNRGW
jgi:pyridoxal 5'-phosphate synthase pdxS subunit